MLSRHPIINFLLIQMLVISTSLAQETSKSIVISGRLQNSSGEVIPYASIAAYSNDSTLLGGSTSDENGAFFTSQSKANYLVIKFLSYQDLIVTIPATTDTKIDLGKLTMKPDAELLKEFELVGEKGTIELHLDKRVYNVGKDLNSTGGTASDILTNVPSVDVDAEGNVSLRGRDNVRILIDGKPSALLGSNNNGLKMLQASMIERIEVITNPSARYEAQGETGVINIILKKEQKKGFNGIFDVGGGYPWGANTSANVNFRTKHINLFAGVGVNYRESPARGYSENEYEGPDTSYHYDNTNHRLRKSFSNSARFGSDFFLGELNTITLSSSIRLKENNNPSNITYRDLNDNQETLHETKRDELEKENSTDLEGSLTYKRTFKKENREWVTSIRYIDSRDFDNSVLKQVSTFKPLDGINQISTNTENERNAIFQTDYVHPLSKNQKFELGARGSFREIQNAFTVDIDSNTGVYKNLAAFTNDMIYTEKIGAAYAIYSAKVKRFGYQIGIRGEYTDIVTNLLKTNQINHRSYLNPFPSAHLSYELSSDNSIQLSYSRRINRPWFRELIPFYSYTDSRNYYSGNPNLNPEFTHSSEFSYLRSLKKGNIMSSIYYRHTDNVVERITVTDSSGLIRRFPTNLSQSNSYGLEITFSNEIYKWWRISGSANFYRSMTNGSYGSKNFSYDTYASQGRVMNLFKLPKDVIFQASLNYRAPRKSTQGTYLARYGIDLALSKDILKGNGTITANCTDLFNSYKWRSITETEYLYATSMMQMRMRYTSINFSYRVNQKKERTPGNSNMMNDGDYEM